MEEKWSVFLWEGGGSGGEERVGVMEGGREGGSQSEQTVSLDLRKNYFFHQHTGF